MFGGPPQQASKAEIKEAEELANREIRNMALGCAVLYFSPFVIDYVSKLV